MCSLNPRETPTNAQRILEITNWLSTAQWVNPKQWWCENSRHIPFHKIKCFKLILLKAQQHNGWTIQRLFLPLNWIEAFHWLLRIQRNCMFKISHLNGLPANWLIDWLIWQKTRMVTALVCKLIMQTNNGPKKNALIMKISINSVQFKQITIENSIIIAIINHIPYL